MADPLGDLFTNPAWKPVLAELHALGITDEMIRVDPDLFEEYMTPYRETLIGSSVEEKSRLEEGEKVLRIGGRKEVVSGSGNQKSMVDSAGESGSGNLSMSGNGQHDVFESMEGSGNQKSPNSGLRDKSGQAVGTSGNLEVAGVSGNQEPPQMRERLSQLPPPAFETVDAEDHKRYLASRSVRRSCGLSKVAKRLQEKMNRYYI